MSLYVITLSLLVGLARGLSLRNFVNYRFKALGCFFGALFLQLFLGTSYAENIPIVRLSAALLNLSSMGMLLWALWANAELFGARAAFIGVLLNIAVIFANGGKMPVSPEAAAAVGMPASRVAFLAAGRSLTHRLLRPETKLWWLADVLYIPKPFPQSPLFSVGDVVLAIGLFFLVQNAMATSHVAPPGESPEPLARPDMHQPVPPSTQLKAPLDSPETRPQSASTQVDTPGPGC